MPQLLAAIAKVISLQFHWIVALVGIWLWLLPTTAIATPENLPIEQARQQLDGVEVQVSGVVTVPSARFESALMDKGFAVQDMSGGIYISTEQSLNLQPGDAVEVVGTVGDDGHGQRIVRLEQWQHREGDHALMPSQQVSVREAARLEGNLVTVQGTLTRSLKDDAPYGDRLWLADDTGTIQIYMPKSTGIQPQSLPFLKPGNTLQVTGFSSQYDGTDEIVPRSVKDLQATG